MRREALSAGPRADNVRFDCRLLDREAMKKMSSASFLVVCAVALGGAGPSAAENVTLVLGTATPGGGFTAYGEALTDALRDVDPGLQIRLRQTAGSKENVPLLEAGRLDLGLVEGTAAHEAFSGIGRAPANLRIVAAMYPTPAMFAVRADSPYRTIMDLKGRRVVFGAAGSGFVLLARYVLDGLGLDPQADFDAVLLQSAKEGPPMVLDGDAAAMWGGGIGWPAFEAIAGGPHGARFIAPAQDEIERIQARHTFLKEMSVPAGSYRGQDRPIATVGSWSLILARPDVPDDLAYRFARALHRAQPRFAARLAQARDSIPANTLSASPSVELIHPGVARYLREIGLKQPAQ
jgi:TRAP transporter TAXI family solute receptor